MVHSRTPETLPVASNAEFADFKSANLSPPEEEFADFQTVTQPAATNPVNDKIAALKALVSDSKMYEVKKDEGQVDEAGDDSEWADFHEASSTGFGGDTLGAVVDTSSAASWQSAETLSAPAHNSEPGGWADFSAAPAGAADKSNHPSASVAELPVAESSSTDWMETIQSDKHIDWGGMGENNKNDDEFMSFESGPPPMISDDKPPKDAKNNVKSNQNTQRRYDYFGRSVEPKLSSGTGLSALDTLPPDLPDMKDEDDEDFDKFGTFQGLEFGVSSIALDDDLPNGGGDMFGYASQSRHNRPEKDTADTVSTSSSEYSGWKGKTSASRAGEDSQSISSLDLPSGKQRPESKEDSPTGDSQSVSSLEFGNPTNVSRFAGTPGDDRSIASLELKVVSTPDEGPLRDQGGFGEYNTDQNKLDNLPGSQNFGDFNSALGSGTGDISMSESFGDFSSAPDSKSDFPTPQAENSKYCKFS